VRLNSCFLFALLAAAVPAAALAQPPKKKDEADFVKQKPAVGETIPDLTVYDPAGKEVKTSSLRGQYTVLVFGCLT
jgi:cytochrome oxidase Cu insertion factor (SCO1/SenC/PrrC family)